MTIPDPTPAAYDATKSTLLFEARKIEAEATALFRQADDHESQARGLRDQATELNVQVTKLREACGWITKVGAQ